MNTSEMATPSTAPVVTGNNGEWRDYDSQLPIADKDGTRVVTVCYKQTAAMKASGKDARNNVYTRIPTPHLTEATVVDAASELAPFVLAYLRSVEDETIRKAHKDGQSSIYCEGLSLAKLMGTLEEAGNGGSIDAEQITEWFTTNMSERITQLICDKLDTDPSDLTGESLAKVSAVVDGYLSAFISLASGKTQMPVAQRTRLATAMEVCSVTDTLMGQRFTKRFAKMLAKEEEALSALGDLDI